MAAATRSSGCTSPSGVCGDVMLDGVKCAALVKWPKAIHEGNGKCVFVVDPATTDQQIEVLAQIFGGKLGGLPWELLGPTFAGRRPREGDDHHHGQRREEHLSASPASAKARATR